jgi:hypothetical protein
MKRYKATGLSLPIDLLKEIDQNRGDIPRSRYLLRILEKIHVDNKSSENLWVNIKSNGGHVPLDSRSANLQSSGTRNP